MPVFQYDHESWGAAISSGTQSPGQTFVLNLRLSVCPALNCLSSHSGQDGVALRLARN